MPPTHALTEHEQRIVDLALWIEDPAGIEAVDLAREILEIFHNRGPFQADLMRQSLWRWSMQFPRKEHDPDRAPQTERPASG